MPGIQERDLIRSGPGILLFQNMQEILTAQGRCFLFFIRRD